MTLTFTVINMKDVILEANKKVTTAVEEDSSTQSPV